MLDPAENRNFMAKSQFWMARNPLEIAIGEKSRESTPEQPLPPSPPAEETLQQDQRRPAA